MSACAARPAVLVPRVFAHGNLQGAAGASVLSRCGNRPGKARLLAWAGRARRGVS